MDYINEAFKNKKINFSKLIPFGFKYDGNVYTYSKTITESGFILTIRITGDGSVSSEIIDPSLEEKYILHLVNGAAGSFVGEVRSQYENTLQSIAKNCFEADIFKGWQTKELIEYVQRTYSCEPEFLWQKFPDNAVWRRADNKKWFGVLLTVSKRKLGIASDETAEIIDLRSRPENMAALIDNSLYFPGWHMNKKSWYTIILDGSVPTYEICRRVDESYLLAVK